MCGDERPIGTSLELVFVPSSAAVSLQHSAATSSSANILASHSLDTPRGFYGFECDHLHNDTLQLFLVDMHPRVMNQEKAIFYISSGMFTPI